MRCGFFLCPARIKEDHVIQHGLVVDGASLSLALREHEKLFMEVCKNCSAVLCCRMAPLQKAKVMLVLVLGMRMDTSGEKKFSRQVSLNHTSYRIFVSKLFVLKKNKTFAQTQMEIVVS